MHCKKCNKVVYVGKTKNRIMERFNGHRADLKMADKSKPAFYFRKDGHKEEDMKVIRLEHVPSADDVYRNSIVGGKKAAEIEMIFTVDTMIFTVDTMMYMLRFLTHRIRF